MLITREIDYAIRTIRALYGSKRLNVKQICELEHIPSQFAYKILKKLSCHHILEITRGAGGGYCLIREPSKLTLFDIFMAVDGNNYFNGINECLKPNHVCINNVKNKVCKVNAELRRINTILEEELKKYTLEEILTM